MKQKKLNIARAMMIATILLIVAFQAYWLHKLYYDELSSIKRETDVGFRDAIYKLQVSRLKSDTLIFKQTGGSLFNVEAINVLKEHGAKGSDSATKRIVLRMKGDTASGIVRMIGDTHVLSAITLERPPAPGERPPGFVFFKKTLSDSLTPATMDSVCAAITEKLINMEGFKNNGGKIVIENRLQKNDTAGNTTFITTSTSATPVIKVATKRKKDTAAGLPPSPLGIFTSRALNDSLSTEQLFKAYKTELQKTTIDIPFSIIKYEGIKKDNIPPDIGSLTTTPVPVGILNPVFYQAIFDNATPFLLRRISSQMLLSLFIIAFTAITFIMLYRNILAQQRLAVIKNDFISNITHELKTPIATVQVAIEAIRNFNALHDEAKTQEYLDISAIELQRLTLLVDKVLKLSMFENKEVELHKEHFDMKQLAEEVLQTMKLQFDKCHARVNLQTGEGNLSIYADRLHILSVLYNLLDNAMKYCKTRPEINVNLREEGSSLVMSVHDNCISIPTEYRDKVFEKFFRVPTGNQHNVKGYGLGLSYVAHIVQQHGGKIELVAESGKGNNFIVHLPKQ